MRKIFYFIFFLFTPLFANDSFSISQDPARNFFSGPSAISPGSVNIITGDFIDTSCDLFVEGPDTFQLDRCYVSSFQENSSLGFGTTWNHHGKLTIDSKNAKYSENFGSSFCLAIEKKAKHFKKYRSNKKQMSQWITNLCAGIISGRTNYRNILLYNVDGLNRFSQNKGCYLVKSNGEKHHFVCHETDTDQKRVLSDLQKPTGVKYHYDYDKNQAITKINASIKDIPFGSLTFTHEWAGRGDYPYIKVEASNGKKVEYFLHKKKSQLYSHLKPLIYNMLDTVYKEGGFFEKYHYVPSMGLQRYFLLSKKEYPDNRFMALEYNACNRVCKQFAPVGKDSSPVCIFSYEYDAPLNDWGKTQVYDALQNYTVYIYDPTYRLRTIKHYDHHQKFCFSEKYAWTGTGELLSSSIIDKNNKEITSTEYHYDNFGNVITQKTKGNFTGTNPYECFVIKRKYSYEGKNLLLEEDDGRKKIQYTYDPVTDLPLNKCIIANEKKILRQFFRYDKFSQVCLEITDDGLGEEMDDLTGVTKRQIKQIQSTQIVPLGLPEIIEEKFWEAGEEKLLKKTINHYSKEGHLIQQDIVDANDHLAYSLYFQYDERGNCVFETDPLSQTTQKQYDLHNNCILEYGKRKDYYKEYKYDFSNRLIQETYVSDQQKLSKHFGYDYCNNKTSETDFWGNETKYQYDAFHREIQVTNAENITTKKEYDELNHLTKIIDGNNQAKTITYTTRGDPIDIQYPDGTHEHFEYSIDGLCLKHITQNNSYTLYTYDALGRVTQEELYSSEGQLISTQHFEYDAFHLLSETDALGNETKYHYDAAGRLIKKENHATTEYVYDSLGRLYKTIEWVDKDHALISIQEQDFLDRITEERTEDESGHIYRQTNYVYDADNNIIEKIHGNHFSKKEYDIFGNCTLEQDEEDHTYLHRISHDEPYQITTDPLGNQKKTIFDSIQRPSEIYYKDISGEIVKHQQIFYDANNNKTKLIENVIADNKPTHQSIILWQYDAMDREIECTEAANTNDERITTTLYNSIGQKEKVIKPSGITLSYFYDSIGRLQELHSSDDTVHYKYEYDALNRPTIIKDLITRTETKKVYDNAGNISEEHLANGLVINYQYDDIGRVIKVQLQDDSFIHYEYQGPNFFKISRHKSSNEFWYDYIYDEVDLRGNVLSAHSNNVDLFYSRNSTGKITSIEAKDKYAQSISYDSRGNINSLQTSLGQNQEFSYDTLSQLIEIKDDEARSTYTYDSLYNPITREENTCSTNNLNELISDGTNNYLYSKDGNFVQINNTCTLHYDALDRLIKVCKDGRTIHYTYDADNRRLTKNNTRYLYIGSNEVGAYEKNQLTQFRVLGVGKGAEIGATVAIELNSIAYSVISDVTGSIAALVDKENNQTVTNYTYTSFGKKKVYGEIESPWTYCSKREDPETGFIYFGERYYCPQMQCWITKDPLSYSVDNNLYTYVYNNPLNVYDLYGLFGINIGLNYNGNTLSFGAHEKTTGIGATFTKDNTELHLPRLSQQHRSLQSILDPSCYNLGNYEPDVRLALFFVNGIGNSLKDAQTSAIFFGNLFERQVTLVYNPSHGIVSDVTRHVAGVSKKDARVLLLREKVLESIQAHELTIIGCHSQGALITYLAIKDFSAEQKARVRPITVGCAKFIFDLDFNKARNYVNDTDPVPRNGDPNGYKKARGNGTLHKLQTNSWFANIDDHEFRHLNYQEALKREAKSIIEKYGRGKLCIKK